VWAGSASPRKNIFSCLVEKGGKIRWAAIIITMKGTRLLRFPFFVFNVAPLWHVNADFVHSN
jgi:hypothetical protein